MFVCRILLGCIVMIELPIKFGFQLNYKTLHHNLIEVGI